jgi:LuxR family maltose regulon positive regulatory protein
MAGNPNPKEGLRAVHDHRLTFLIGGSDSTRTALLRGWANAQSKAQGLRIVFLGLRADDNLPHSFFKHLIRTFRDAGLKLERCWVAEYGDHKAFDLEEDLIDLINLVDGGVEDYILILDNYDVIEEDTIHAAVEFMLDFLPEKMHVVISSQVEPPLRVAKLRVRRQLLVLELEDLLG